MMLGAHVSTAGGVAEAPARGAAIGCDAIQIFAKNQRQWAAKPYTAEEISRWRDQWASSGLAKSLVHASYLVNLATPDAAMWRKSVAGLSDEYDRCTQLGVDFLVFHPGAHNGSGEEKGLAAIAKGVRELLAAHPGSRVGALIENTAGQGTVVGYSFEHLAELLRLIDEPRVGVCLDFQHAFAAGFDTRTKEGYRDTFSRFDEVVGLERLRAFHVNDSKKPLGSRVDRHECIGKGEMGLAPFTFLVNDPRFAEAPKILETPEPERWPEEIRLLRSLKGKVRLKP